MEQMMEFNELSINQTDSSVRDNHLDRASAAWMSTISIRTLANRLLD
jgi:hypothetical protein